MVTMTLRYANGEREERSCMEAELAMAREWVVKAQESLSKLQESLDMAQGKNERLRGLRDFDAQ